MKKRRNRAIRKAQLPHEKALELGKAVKENAPLIKLSEYSDVTIYDENNNEIYKGKVLTSDVKITSSEQRVDVKSPYTEYVEEVLEKEEIETAFTKAKNFLKGIFKR